MKPHPQAELLRAIADGEEMEQAYHQEPKWRAVDSTTVLDWITNGSLEYYTPYFRIKPKTININGIEVPEPMREMPPEGTSVYWPGFGPDSGDTHTESADVGYYPDILPDLLRKGLLHLTEEAAAIHANALLSLTRRT